MRRVFTEHEQWVMTGGKKGQRGSLVEENLGYLDLSHRDLSGIILKGCNLEGADFTKSVLLFANLSKGKLTDAVLSSAALSGASLSGADLSRADLSGALLTPIPVRSAEGSETGRMRKTDLRNALLKDAVLEGLDLTQCIVTS